MENDKFKEEFLQIGVHHYLEKTFQLTEDSIFLKK